MKKQYLLTVVISFLVFNINAQFVDNMESYMPGQPINVGHWTNWGCGGSTGCAIMSSTTQAQEGNQSGYIPGDNTTDAVLDLGNQIFGVWGISFWMYVPSGKEAYWDLQAIVPVGAGEWPVGNIFFNGYLDSPNIGLIDNSVQGPINFGFPHDQWFRVVMNWDLSGGMPAATWQFNVAGADVVPAGTAFRDSNNTIPTSLGGINFFSHTPDIEFWLDNFVYESNFITVIPDTEDPVAVCQDITTQLDSNGSININGYDIGSGSTDNNGVVSFIVVPDNFDCNDIGTQTVTLTIADATGNTDTCTATVTIEDDLAPSMMAQSATGDLNGSGSVTIPISSVDIGSYDNCGIDTMTLTPDTFTELGNYTAVLEGTDPSGNSSSITVNITIIDSTLGLIDQSFNNYSIYPNPVSDIIAIEVGDSIFISKVEFFDITGKLIIDKKLDQLTQKYSIDLNGFSKGIYFISISDEFGNKEVKKFIKY